MESISLHNDLTQNYTPLLLDKTFLVALKYILFGQIRPYFHFFSSFQTSCFAVFSRLQITPGPFLLLCVLSGSTWMCCFPQPPSCICAPSLWTATSPFATRSSTAAPTPEPEPRSRSQLRGLSLWVRAYII